MNERCSILGGAIRSGKTSALRAWAGRGEAAGFLSPDGPEGRLLVNAATGECLPFEAGDGDEAVQAIGRFRFLDSAFAAGADWIREGLRAGAPWLLMDEIGPLELSGGGFDALLRETLAALEAAPVSCRLLIVVREPLLTAVQERYSLQGAELVTKERFGGG